MRANWVSQSLNNYTTLNYKNGVLLSDYGTYRVLAFRGKSRCISGNQPVLLVTFTYTLRVTVVDSARATHTRQNFALSHS